MRVLVADDDEVSSLALADRLEDLGYTVELASDGAQAWEKILENQYRLLVLDWVMPGIDGVELCRRVRQLSLDRYLYIILMTSKADRSDKLEALEGGADDFLTKPLDQGELMARLQAANRMLRYEGILVQANAELVEARSKELQIGAHIQQRLLYSPPPDSFGEYRFVTVSIPSQQVDGDFCDHFSLSEFTIDIVAGDVMGKGVSAALIGAGVKTNLQRSLLELATRKGSGIPEPSEIISQLDLNTCSELIEIEAYLTLCYARFDRASCNLSYINAGHPKMMLWRAMTDEVELLDTTAVPVGFLEGGEYPQGNVTLDMGDLVVIYSDGVTDLQSQDGRRLGVSGFTEWLKERASLPLNTLREELLSLRAKFTDSSKKDDFTCVVARFAGPLSKESSTLSTWADQHNLRCIRDFAAEAAERLGLARGELGRVRLAVQEAASNAVRHARPGHHGLPLSIEVRKEQDSLVIQMRYPGVAFDASSVPVPAFDGSKEGGFGVDIIRKCMTSVRYEATGLQNVLTMVKDMEVDQ